MLMLSRATVSVCVTSDGLACRCMRNTSPTECKIQCDSVCVSGGWTRHPALAMYLSHPALKISDVWPCCCTAVDQDATTASQGAPQYPLGSTISKDLQGSLYICPGGSFVQSLQGSFSNSLMNLGPFTCTNGATIGAQSDGGSWPADTSNTGFRAVRLFWDSGTDIDSVNQITGFGLLRTNGSAAAFHGATTSANSATIRCPDGMVVSGFVGSQGFLSSSGLPKDINKGVYRIGLVCRFGV